MPQHHNHLHSRNSDNIPVTKPNAISLFTHIVRATLLDGMQWPVLFSILLASSLHYFNIAHHESLTLLIITGILVTGLIRGCNAWQNDLNDYQYQLAMTRQQQLDSETDSIIPGYFPSRRY